MNYRLPAEVAALCKARDALKHRFNETRLNFTLDGKLVGDIGEALALEFFDLKPCPMRTKGVDCVTQDNRQVQVKATGRANSGPAFTPGDGVADQLLFIRLDFDAETWSVAYNGPEAPIRDLLPEQWSGTVVVRLAKVIEANGLVAESDRLPLTPAADGLVVP
jgi:hypothetical protein